MPVAFRLQALQSPLPHHVVAVTPDLYVCHVGSKLVYYLLFIIYMRTTQNYAWTN